MRAIRCKVPRWVEAKNLVAEFKAGGDTAETEITSDEEEEIEDPFSAAERIATRNREHVKRECRRRAGERKKRAERKRNDESEKDGDKKD